MSLSEGSIPATVDPVRFSILIAGMPWKKKMSVEEHLYLL